MFRFGRVVNRIVMSLLVGGHRGHSLCVLILLRYLDAAALIKRVTARESRCAWEPVGKYFQILTLPKTLWLVFHFTSSNMSIIHGIYVNVSDLGIILFENRGSCVIC